MGVSAKTIDTRLERILPKGKFVRFEGLRIMRVVMEGRNHNVTKAVAALKNSGYKAADKVQASGFCVVVYKTQKDHPFTTIELMGPFTPIELEG